MRNQLEINAQWHVTDGQFTFLVQPRHVTKGLRKPYEYELELDQIEALVLALRGIANRFKSRLQCSYVESKRLAFGRRINFFFLGYRPGFCGDDTGITNEDWQDLAYRLNSHLAALQFPASVRRENKPNQ
jgi:hypothetical protein